MRSASTAPLNHVGSLVNREPGCLSYETLLAVYQTAHSTDDDDPNHRDNPDSEDDQANDRHDLQNSEEAGLPGVRTLKSGSITLTKSVVRVSCFTKPKSSNDHRDANNGIDDPEAH